MSEIASIRVYAHGSRYVATAQNAKLETIGVIYGDTLGHATFEMLRCIRGEREFDSLTLVGERASCASGGSLL